MFIYESWEFIMLHTASLTRAASECPVCDLQTRLDYRHSIDSLCMLLVSNDVPAKEGRDLDQGLLVLHTGSLITDKAHNLSRLLCLQPQHNPC